jgi:N utilization substance protein A
MTVVEEVDDPELEISTEDAERHGLEAEVGEELGFQIFYLAGDMERAREQDRLFGHLLGISQQRQGFGRIAAQTAKQVIIQRVRDAERERVFNDYKNRIGEIVTGVVRRFERGSNIIVDFGNGVEAVLPSREQTPRESYRPGDRVEALLKSIDREARGPQIILSRTDVGLLVKLFEREVPEIFEGIVRVVAAAREPGARSKIAVSSRDSDVDPVGACVGMKGSRVQAVVQELRGEKIDIVPFDRDPARFVCNAIAPAEVVRVVIDETGQSMELVVPDSKLSLAIGRRGQNVRLASQLTKWRLDIVSEVRFKQMEEEAIEVLGRVGDANLGRTLYRLGFRTLDEVAEAAGVPREGREIGLLQGLQDEGHDRRCFVVTRLPRGCHAKGGRASRLGEAAPCRRARDGRHLRSPPGTAPRAWWWRRMQKAW